MPSQPKWNPLLHAAGQLYHVNDQLCPLVADPATADPTVLAVAKICAALAQVLEAKSEQRVEFAPARPGFIAEMERAVDAQPSNLSPVEAIERAAVALADPPFDASTYERPEHHVSCLCTDNLARGVGAP